MGLSVGPQSFRPPPGGGSLQKQDGQPEDSATDREIDRALSVLPPREQAVVSAISVDGRSIGETALSLDMTEGAVRVALHRGLSRIARTFGRT